MRGAQLASGRAGSKERRLILGIEARKLSQCMCRRCYDGFGSPAIDTADIRRLAQSQVSLSSRFRDEERAWDVEDAALDNDLMGTRWSEPEYH